MIIKTNSAIERNYQFRQQLNQVHAPNRRNVNAAPVANEWMIENGGRITVGNAKKVAGFGVHGA